MTFKRTFTLLVLFVPITLSFDQFSMGLPSKDDLDQVQTQAPEVDCDSIDDDASTDEESTLPLGQIQFTGFEGLTKPRTAPLPESGNLMIFSSSFVQLNRAVGFQWRSALKQSLLFLSLQHGYAMTQPKTRRELSGAFLRDYLRSVAALGAGQMGEDFSPTI
jgi:hypothetical protein